MNPAQIPVMPGKSYTVTQRDNCTLIFGQIPVQQFVALTRATTHGDVVVSPHLARLAGATFAYGPPEDVAALVKSLIATQSAAPLSATDTLGPAAAKWLAFGEQGASSATMFWAFTGIKPQVLGSNADPVDHPHDADDFRRCRLLLEGVPRFAGKMDRLRSVSPTWDRLVTAWSELCALMDAEAPLWREQGGMVELTTERLREIIQAQ